jgi:sterol 3beta-glucosyltransferase
MVLPLKDIENVDKEKGFRFGYSGLVVVIRGHEELFFEFGAADARDDCAVTLHQSLEKLKESEILTKKEKKAAEAAREEHDLLAEARTEGHASHDHALPRSAAVAGKHDKYTPKEDVLTCTDEFVEAPPIIFDDPNSSLIECKPAESLNITCLTIGSRGDVQPYIALCKGLIAEGHHAKIATHKEFKDWIEGHGIEFAQVEGDPAELMRICVENGMFTYSFLKEASSKVSVIYYPG